MIDIFTFLCNVKLYKRFSFIQRELPFFADLHLQSSPHDVVRAPPWRHAYMQMSACSTTSNTIYTLQTHSRHQNVQQNNKKYCNKVAANNICKNLKDVSIGVYDLTSIVSYFRRWLLDFNPLSCCVLSVFFSSWHCRSKYVLMCVNHSQLCTECGTPRRSPAATDSMARELKKTMGSGRSWGHVSSRQCSN